MSRGLAHLRELLDAYDQVNADFETVDYGDPDAMDALLEKQANLQDAIDAADAWELIVTSRLRWTPSCTRPRCSCNSSQWRRA